MAEALPLEEIAPWHSITTEEVVSRLKTDSHSGLTLQEAKHRLLEHGGNEIAEVKGESAILAFLRHFTDFIVLVLIAAALVSALVGEWLDTVAILLIVVLNAVLGFFQEYRAEKSLAALRKLAAPNSKVLRDGTVHVIPARDLVPGDIIFLEAGDSVPADARLTSSTFLKIEEASLTGESTPVTKSAESVLPPETPLADRTNMVFLGSSVSYGKGRAVITATGMFTELGKIATLVQSVKKESTPLQRRLDQVGKFLAVLFLTLSALVFFLGVLRGEHVIDMLLTAVSLAVAAIPEGLPAVVTISLALGVQRMVKRHVLVRKLPSVETLGSVTQICTDKTGTLTEGKMAVTSIYVFDREFTVTGVGYEPSGTIQRNETPVKPGEDEALELTLRIATLCNDAQLVGDHHWGITGDPTEGALLVAAAKLGMWKHLLEDDFPVIMEIPFDSDRKRMTSVRDDGAGKRIAFVKGAPDVILRLSSSLHIDGKIVPLDTEKRTTLADANKKMAEAALRVLAVAYRSDVHTDDPPAIEKELTFVGLLGMTDPPRKEVLPAIQRCNTANIGVTMITGDHQITAVAIARELGIMTPGSIAISGPEIEQMSDNQLEQAVGDIRVYARATAEHKLRIIKAWKAQGHIVAMTGDGVNDAVALKEADIGIAMGITGTDVTKEASDMVLTDDNFASIVAAVEEGRTIYNNIKKFIYFLLSCNTGEVLTMLLGFLLGLPLPLLPLQILWINLITDGFPALALGIDPSEPGLMSRPPRDPREQVINLNSGLLLAFQGLLMAGVTLSAFYLTLISTGGDLVYARTVAFAALAFTQLYHAFNWRSMSLSIFQVGIFSNPHLVIAVLVSAVIQTVAMYSPLMQAIFDTVPLSLDTYVWILALSSTPLIVMELAKLVWRQFSKKRRPQ